MSRISIFIVGSIACACTHLDAARPARDICEIRLSKTIEVDDLQVLVFTDSHGSYLRVDACPSRTVAADFSNSELFAVRNKDLLKRMQVSAYQGGNPIKMRISGTYTGSDGNNIPATMKVGKILEYE